MGAYVNELIALRGVRSVFDLERDRIGCEFGAPTEFMGWQLITRFILRIRSQGVKIWNRAFIAS